MSILMDFDPYDNDNTHFQVAIDQWQETFDRSAKKCNNKRRTESDTNRSVPRVPMRSTDNHAPSEFPVTPWEYMKRMTSVYEDNDYDSKKVMQNKTYDIHESSISHKRTLTDNSPFGTGGWDPFSPSLKKVCTDYKVIDLQHHNHISHKCLFFIVKPIGHKSIYHWGMSNFSVIAITYV